MEVTVVLLAVVTVAASPYRVTNDAECEAYLCKYGYTYSLSCACPPEMAADTRVMPSAQWRQEHSAQSVDASISAVGGGGNAAASSHGASVELRPCTPAEFATALAVFQRTNRLAVTGTCDADTRSLMSSARCGVVDDYAAASEAQPEANAAPASGSDSDGPTVAHRNLSLADSGGRDDEDGVGESIPKDAAPSAALTAVAKYSNGPGPLDSDRPQEASGRPAALTAAASSLLGGAAQQPRNFASLRSLLAPNSGGAGRGPTKINQLLRPPGVSAGGGSVGRKRPPGMPQLEVGRRTAEGGKATLDTLGGGHRVRPRRSTEIASAPPVSPWANRTKPIRWRIVRYANRLSASEQDGAMEQAFRKWAAVTPLCFLRDVNSDVRKLDVVIGFFEGPHGGDFRQFDGYGGEIAHTYPMQFTHFDAAESWTVGGPGSSTGYNLLSAATHEFGHLLGLSNSPSDNSVMNSLYSDQRRLSDEDVAAASALYGHCNGRFDAVVDVVFSEDELDDNGLVVTRRYYSTIFFRGSINWLYKNSRKRPNEGEPMAITSAFSGLPNSLDAVVQYSLRRDTDGTFVDILFAFKGSQVYVYDYRGRRVLRSGTISSFFPGRNDSQTIPNNLDSAYFDPRDGNIYFFKDDQVYAYHYRPDAPHSCCEFIKRIVEVFPPAQNTVGAGAAAQIPTYRRNLDAAYVSFRDESLYLIKGEDVWVTGNMRGPPRVGTQLTNSMHYDGHWNQRWRYICETDC